MGAEGVTLDYSAEDDMLYFHFKDGPAKSVEEVEDNVMVELDKEGAVMAMEVWGVRKKGVLEQLTRAAAHP
ncbi:MAG: DUF2283 domain-containing protein [Nitrososphaerota archaeon]|nr:DUF2283 domain-containing protein [Nitrososphaerota archaeon]MDG6977796.1 DUF2283 domain-containing protein [Nitrososphaerota archaeon]